MGRPQRAGIAGRHVLRLIFHLPPPGAAGGRAGGPVLVSSVRSGAAVLKPEPGFLSRGKTLQIQTDLFFEGRCEQAIAFYKAAVGAKVGMMMRYKKAPEPPDPEKRSPAPGFEDRIMHASLQIGETALTLSDGMCQGRPDFKGFALSIRAKDAAEAAHLFTALGRGGRMRMPLGKTFFSPQFGVLWMVLVTS